MAEENNKLEALSKRLDELLSMHNDVSNEIDSLRVEIIRIRVALKSKATTSDSKQSEEMHSPTEESLVIESSESIDIPESQINSNIEVDDKPIHALSIERTISNDPIATKKRKFDIEKLIGENLINKIGILVLIFGVAIGAKYTIENDLISPLTRIILGYLAGIVLLGLGMYLKKNYLNFSAVLVSGAMAILYFITFFAFNFYQLIGQEVAFGLMVLFTIFTVLAALNYDKEVIAHLGLVGAVGVPFLLSNDTGNALFLFSYMTIINLGIAFISLKKNWKPLFYSAFALTWIVYFTWIGLGYDSAKDFILALSFLTVFFLLFYIIFIAYKFIKLKKYNAGDVIVLLLNSIIFFGIGYGLLSEHETANQILGAFALVNAFFHFVAAYIINTRKLADKNLFYLIIGLVLTCLTLAIPIQLDGTWVTMMWTAEALVLFFIGRSRKVAFYEYISFVLMGIAALSLFQYWESEYPIVSQISAYYPAQVSSDWTPFMNPIFLTSVVVILFFGLITWIHFKSEWRKTSKVDHLILNLLDFVVPITFITILFLAFRMEILNYFNQLYVASEIQPAAETNNFYSKIYNTNIRLQANLWLLDYALVFFSVLTYFITKKVKNIQAHWVMIALNMLFIASFLIQGLYELSELRANFLSQENAEYYNIDRSFTWLRYLSILCLAFLVGSTYFLLKKVNQNYTTKVISETIFYLILLWVTTSELIHWLDFTKRSEPYGLVLSIYWGIFSVIIVALGIWKKKQHIRILGISIFAVTLIKLFFYDLSNLNTIAKTIVMISLGALLLLTSFLYNKYKIEDEQTI